MPPGGVGCGKAAMLQQTGKKGLGQVLGIGGRVALLAEKGVQGWPVGATKLFQRRDAIRQMRLAGFDHQTPLCQRKGGDSVPDIIATRSLLAHRCSQNRIDMIYFVYPTLI